MSVLTYDILDSEREPIKARLKEFLEKKPGIQFAYLYGSFLKTDRFRDIDVAIFLREPASLPLRHEVALADELWRFSGKPAFEFDIKILNSSPVYFQYEVIKTGEVIYSKDEAERVEYEASLASEYLDYKPTLDFFDQELLERIG